MKQVVDGDQQHRGHEVSLSVSSGTVTSASLVRCHARRRPTLAD
jgi:hypothetical protein